MFFLDEAYPVTSSLASQHFTGNKGAKIRAFITQSSSTLLSLRCSMCVTSCTLEQDVGMKGKLMSSAGDKIAVEKKVVWETNWDGFLMLFASALWGSYCILLTGEKHSFRKRLILLFMPLFVHSNTKSLVSPWLSVSNVSNLLQFSLTGTKYHWRWKLGYILNQLFEREQDVNIVVFHVPILTAFRALFNLVLTFLKSCTSTTSSLPFPILKISMRWPGSISIMLSVSTPSSTALYWWSYTWKDIHSVIVVKKKTHQQNTSIFITGCTFCAFCGTEK